MFWSFSVISKICRKHDLVKCANKPRLGVIWHLVWGLLDPIELLCRREIFSYFLYILVLDIFKLIMVTIQFQSANMFLSNNDELRQQISTYINIMRWDYSPTNPVPMCQLTPMTCVYFMLLLQKAEAIMTNHFRKPYFVAQQGSVT